MYWLRERIHPMWHLAVLCYGVVIGVAAAQQVQADISGWIVVVITIIIGCAALKTRRRYALVLMAVVGVFAGLARGSADQSQLKLYEPLIGRQVVIDPLNYGFKLAKHGFTEIRQEYMNWHETPPPLLQIGRAHV